MKQLLAELKVIDPDCYEEIWQWALWQEGDDGPYSGDEPEYRMHRDDSIQGACQRAIAKIGWSWKIINLPSGLYIAEINQLAGGYMGDHYEVNHEYLIVESTAGSPAGAILTAYIAARKACP